MRSKSAANRPSSRQTGTSPPTPGTDRPPVSAAECAQGPLLPPETGPARLEPVLATRRGSGLGGGRHHGGLRSSAASRRGKPSDALHGARGPFRRLCTGPDRRAWKRLVGADSTGAADCRCGTPARLDDVRRRWCRLAAAGKASAPNSDGRDRAAEGASAGPPVPGSRPRARPVSGAPLCGVSAGRRSRRCRGPGGRRRR